MAEEPRPTPGLVNLFGLHVGARSQTSFPVRIDNSEIEPNRAGSMPVKKRSAPVKNGSFRSRL